MFTKLLIFLAVGCTLALANSADENKYHQLRRQPRGIIGTLGSWVHTAFNIATYPYRKTFDILLQTGLGFKDYGEEKVDQAIQKYNEIKLKYQQNLDAIKSEILKEAIGELQNVVNTLAHSANVETCDDIKESNKRLALTGKAALDKLEQDLQDAVDNELQNLQGELSNWQIEADNAVKESQKRRNQKKF